MAVTASWTVACPLISVAARLSLSVELSDDADEGLDRRPLVGIGGTQERAEIETKLERLARKREQIGPVNPLAERAMAERIERRSGYLRDFAAAVSHEFKTPLAGIRGAVELLGWLEIAVDDAPYGGGAGMVLRPEPLKDALDKVLGELAGTIPLVVVPSSYSQAYEDELAEAGASLVIYANHLLRAAYPAMVATAESILEHGRAKEAEDALLPIRSALELIPGNR